MNGFNEETNAEISQDGDFEIPKQKKLNIKKPKKTPEKPLQTLEENKKETPLPKEKKIVKSMTKGSKFQIVNTTLLNFETLPLDYKTEDDSFDHISMRIRKADSDFIQALSKESGKPIWVVMKSIVQSFKAHKQ